MLDLVFRRRHAVRLAGLALLVAGIALAAGIAVPAGIVLIALAAIVLALVQPQILARVRSRRAQRLAPRNGHGPGADASELDDFRP